LAWERIKVAQIWKVKCPFVGKLLERLREPPKWEWGLHPPFKPLNLGKEGKKGVFGPLAPLNPFKGTLKGGYLPRRKKLKEMRGV